MKIKLLLGVLTSTLAFTSCMKLDDLDLSKAKGIDLDGTYGVALFNDEFTAMYILKRFDSLNQIFINDEGYISYIAGLSSSSLIGNDYIILTDQTENGNFGLPPAAVTAFNLAATGTTVTDSTTEDWHFNIPPYELDSIIYNSGMLNIDITSSFTIPVEVTLRLGGLRRANGSLFSETVTLSSAGTSSVTLDLSGCKADFTLNGTSHSRLSVTTVISLTKNAPTDNVIAGQQIDYSLNVENQIFRKINGYFGQEPLTIPTRILDVEIFKGATSEGDIHIEEPRLNLYFDNSYGMGVRINTLSPFVGRTANGTEIPITGVTLPFTIDRANAAGDKQRSTLILKAPEVNIHQLAEAPVTEIEFGASATINPAGVQKNFALDTSKVTLTSEIEIPFYGSFKNFGIESQNNFTPPKDADILEFAEIKLIIENSFPFGLNFQIFFLDSLDNTVDSLFKTLEQTRIIPTASIDNTGKVTNAAVKTSFIRLDQALLKKLQEQNVTQIKTRVEALSFDNGNTSVKVFPDNSIVLKAGVKVKVKGTVN